MRIQHNITAMNAYRNYNNNTSAVSKNLEKLSSGYKINRAGDDAAGLAVSQKMRLQIAGLVQAQKNAKSGISYVQTAEGALQEVHEMLERMYTLAEQSANGTFDSSTDRTQLQKEVNSLMEEINRIGKTANFNGMGIFKQYAGSSAAFYEATGTINGAALTGADVAESKSEAQAAVYEVSLAEWEDANASIVIDGTTINEDNLMSFQGAAKDTNGQKYTIQYDNTTYKMTITAKKAGPDTLDKADIGILDTGKPASDALTVKTKGANAQTIPAHKTYDLSNLQDGDSITVNGKTYTFADDGDGTGGKFKDLDTLKTALAADGVTMDDTTNTAVTFTSGDGGGGGDTPGTISFWIGAENIGEGANKLTIETMSLEVGDISVEDAARGDDAVGVDLSGKVTAGDISAVDITTADNAMSFLDTIKKASDSVSNMRGTLGAMQNRLDHTIKNLSVMQENMQDAESVIRDTDVADEMMAYTKNNILIQSAQAMLAQANQLPQGVLQLLQ